MSNWNPTDTREQERQAEAEAKAAEHRKRQEVEDFRWLVGHPQGRRVAWGLLERSGQFKSSMTGNSQTFANEGARTIGLWLVDMFHRHALDAYLKMVKENTSE